jgi:hypothetical protein
MWNIPAVGVRLEEDRKFRFRVRQYISGNFSCSLGTKNSVIGPVSCRFDSSITLDGARIVCGHPSILPFVCSYGREIHGYRTCSATDEQRVQPYMDAGGNSI